MQWRIRKDTEIRSVRKTGRDSGQDSAAPEKGTVADQKSVYACRFLASGCLIDLYYHVPLFVSMTDGIVRTAAAGILEIRDVRYCALTKTGGNAIIT